MLKKYILIVTAAFAVAGLQSEALAEDSSSSSSGSSMGGSIGASFAAAITGSAGTVTSDSTKGTSGAAGELSPGFTPSSSGRGRGRELSPSFTPPVGDAFDTAAFKAQVKAIVDAGDVVGLQNFIKQAVRDNPGQEADIAAASVEASPRTAAIAIAATTQNADEATAQAVVTAALQAAGDDSSTASTIRRAFQVTRPDIAGRVLANISATSTPTPVVVKRKEVPVEKENGTPVPLAVVAGGSSPCLPPESPAKPGC